MATKTNIDELNKLLRGELSAVETYQMALDKLDPASTARTELSSCMASHQQRVMMLRDAIVALGGTPVSSSGPWGAFAKAVEGTAKVFGDKAAIAALEEGEDHGLKDYKRELDDTDLDPQARRIVADQLLPAQQQTHFQLSSLKKRMSA
jgi:uncharacterized protein (TIGR02284 family)